MIRRNEHEANDSASFGQAAQRLQQARVRVEQLLAIVIDQRVLDGHLSMDIGACLAAEHY